MKTTAYNLTPRCYTNFGIFMGYVSGIFPTTLEFENLRGELVQISVEEPIVPDFPDWKMIDCLETISRKEWEGLVRLDQELVARTSLQPA